MTVQTLKNPYGTVTFTTAADGELSVILETERLKIVSVRQEHLDEYVKLFGDPKVMEKFGDGKPKTQLYVQNRFVVWTDRWKTTDPYSALTIFSKASNEFIGHIVLGHGDKPGEAEAACVIHEQFWKQKYGTEAAAALSGTYAPATVLAGYLLNGQPLEAIYATARIDNVGSNAILQQKGAKLITTSVEYGGIRHRYVSHPFRPQNPFSFALGKPLAECSMKALIALSKKPLPKNEVDNKKSN